MIVGCGGAGKSALARAMRAISGLPLIHLDHHYWGPGWEPMPGPEWLAHQRELLAGDRWIADGNYGGTLDMRAGLADTIVVLDRPRRVCITRAVRRLRSPVLQAPGCPQKADREFLRWIWTFPKRTRPKILAVLDRHAGRAEVVHLRTDADVRAFLSRLRKERADDGPAAAETRDGTAAGAERRVAHPR
jgi:adenylate kinase family enzyme